MAAGSETEGGLLVSDVGVLQKDTVEDQRFFDHVKAPPHRRRSAMRARLCLITSADKPNGGGGRGRNGGAELRPECSQRAPLGCAHV